MYYNASLPRRSVDNLYKIVKSVLSKISLPNLPFFGRAMYTAYNFLLVFQAN